MAISHDGSTVIGTARDSNIVFIPFRWTVASGMHAIDALEEAYDVSADGSVVVGWGYVKINGLSLQRAARWTAAGGVQFLGTLGGPQDGDMSRGYGVSSDGAWVVGVSSVNDVDHHAFRWSSATGMQDLGSLPGRDWSQATAVSADGSVVVGYSGTGSSRRAFVWTPAGGMQDLGTLGGDVSRATDVSDDGSVVVGVSQIADGTYRAFRWTETTGMVQLYTGRVGLDPHISPDGSTIIVWGTADSSGSTFRNRIWTAETGVLNLDSLIIHHYGFSDWINTIYDIGVKDFTLTDNRLILMGGYLEAWRLVLEPWPLCAPQIAWDGGGDGTSFSDSLNWVGDRVPEQGDIAHFNSSAGAPAVQFSGDVINTGLHINDIVQMDLQGHIYGLTGNCGTSLQVDGTAQLTLEDGTVRILLGDVYIGPSQAPELVLRDGGILDMTGPGVFRVAAGDTARMSILAGGQVQLGNSTLVIGESTYPGWVLVQATPDSTVLRSRRLLIGEGSYGILRIEGGSVVSNTLRMGKLIGSKARAVVFGNGSVLVVTEGAQIGIRGQGTVTVHSFGRIGLLAADEWVLGVEPEGEGTLELFIGSELVSAGGLLVVGDRGRGHLVVLDGSRAEDLGLVWVGRQAGSSGSITVGVYAGSAPSRMTVDGMCVGCGGAGVVGVDSVSLLLVKRLQVGPLGIVRGPVLVMEHITPPEVQRGVLAQQDSVGIRVGQLVLQENATVEVDSVAMMPGGQLGGGGVFPFDLVNRGVVAPGDSVGHTDTLTVQGNYIQTSEGTLEVELGDPSDLLLVSGDAQLDGTLRIGLAEGFTPQVGDTFVVMQYGDLGSGVFSQIVFSQGLEGTVRYGSGLVQVVVSSVASIADEPELLPVEVALYQNYPNPFNPVTHLAFELPHSGFVELTIYDVLGREVKTLVRQQLPPGYHTVQWDGTDATGRTVGGGVYVVRLTVGQAPSQSFTATRKIILLR